ARAARRPTFVEKARRRGELTRRRASFGAELPCLLAAPGRLYYGSSWTLSLSAIEGVLLRTLAWPDRIPSRGSETSAVASIFDPYAAVPCISGCFVRGDGFAGTTPFGGGLAGDQSAAAHDRLARREPLFS